MDQKLKWHRASDGARIPFADTETGDSVIVLLHGGYGSYRDFEHFDERFGAAGYRVIRPELRPHDNAELPAGADFSFPRITSDIKEILDNLGIARAHVAGWSHGGCLTLQFAHDHPDQVLSLGLFNTYAAMDHGSWFKNLLMKFGGKVSQGLSALMPVAKREQAARSMVRKMFLREKTRAANPEACQRYEDAAISNMTGPAAKRVSESIQLTYAFDARPWISELSMPAFIVTGPDDHIPMRLSQELERLLPNAQLAAWPEGHHHGILFEDADGFSARYLEFLAASVPKS